MSNCLLSNLKTKPKYQGSKGKTKCARRCHLSTHRMAHSRREGIKATISVTESALGTCETQEVH